MNISKIIKISILSLLVILSAVAFWKSLARIYLKNNLSINSLIWVSIWFLIFLVFLSIFSVLVEQKTIVCLVYFLSLISFLLFFRFHYYLLIGLIVVFIVLTISHSFIQKQKQNSLKFSLYSVLKSGLSFILTFFALFIALVSYFYPLIRVDNGEINLPPKVFEFAWKLSNKSFNSALLSFKPEMTVDEIITAGIVMEKFDLNSLPPEIIQKFQGKNLKELSFEEISKDPEIAKIFKEQLEKMSKKIDPKILARQRNEIAEKLGFELRGDEKIIEVINKLVDKRIKSIFGPQIKYLPIFSAALTFFLLKITFVPISWLVLIVSFIIFQLLLFFHVVKIEKVMKEGEDVKL